MKDLIEALQLMQSYLTEDVRWPSCCEHDCIYFHLGLQWSDFSPEHQERLDELGFGWDDDLECIYSTRFGSC